MSDNKHPPSHWGEKKEVPQHIVEQVKLDKGWVENPVDPLPKVTEEEFDAAHKAVKFVKVRVVCPKRQEYQGFWSAGVHWPEGETVREVTEEQARRLKHEIDNGHSILILSKAAADEPLSPPSPVGASKPHDLKDEEIPEHPAQKVKRVLR